MTSNTNDTGIKNTSVLEIYDVCNAGNNINVTDSSPAA
jgi:hypothetical protein